MKKCLHCSIAWGLQKPFWWNKDFCSERCQKDYQKAAQQRVRVADFHRWLYSRPP